MYRRYNDYQGYTHHTFSFVLPQPKFHLWLWYRKAFGGKLRAFFHGGDCEDDDGVQFFQIEVKKCHGSLRPGVYVFSPNWVQRLPIKRRHEIHHAMRKYGIAVLVNGPPAAQIRRPKTKGPPLLKPPVGRFGGRENQYVS